MAESLSEKMAAWIKDNQGKHLCACGCGGVIKITRQHHNRGIPRFLQNHACTPPADRFWNCVAKGEGCWLWTGRKSGDGYGRLYLGRRAAPSPKVCSAHRFSWELHNGPIPEGMQVLHNCPGGDTPACVNPAHLWLGTQQDNIADMDRKGRRARGDRISQPGERHGMVKITAAMVLEIRERAAAGETQRKLAAEFGICFQQVNRIVLGKRWRHLLPT